MKNFKAMRLTVAAFCIVINIIGAYIALSFKLPVYLDSIGTLLAAALLGPWYAMAAGMGSAFISGITSDIYAFYFMPVALITGGVAGMLFRTPLFKGHRLPLGAMLLTVPGTAASASISAFLFGGVTSSGSSIFVQLLSHMGCNLVVSAFLVQIVTDYADRLLSLALVLVLASCITAEMKIKLRGGQHCGTV